MLTITPNRFKQAPFAMVDGVDGYTPPSDCQVLLGLCSESSGNILEIGTNQGRVALHFSLNFPLRQVVAWDYGKSVETMVEEQKPECAGVKVGRWLAVQRNAMVVNSFFGQEGLETVGLRYGFAFVDADHSFEGVKRDTEAVVGWMEPGGLVVWHDYLEGQCKYKWIEVGDYIRSLEGDFKRVEGTSIVYSRVGQFAC